MYTFHVQIIKNFVHLDNTRGLSYYSSRTAASPLVPPGTSIARSFRKHWTAWKWLSNLWFRKT